MLIIHSIPTNKVKEGATTLATTMRFMKGNPTQGILFG